MTTKDEYTQSSVSPDDGIGTGPIGGAFKGIYEKIAEEFDGLAALFRELAAAAGGNKPNPPQS